MLRISRVFFPSPAHSSMLGSLARKKTHCLRLWVFYDLRREGDSNPRYPNRVRQFSKLVD